MSLISLVYSFNILTRPLLLSWLVLALTVRTISYASVRIRIIILCARPSKALRLYLHWYFPRAHNTINFQPCVLLIIVYSLVCLVYTTMCCVFVLYVHYRVTEPTTLLTDHIRVGLELHVCTYSSCVQDVCLR